MSETRASFSGRFLRNGDQIFVIRDVINRNGDGVALFQQVDARSGVVAPNWDATGKTGAELQAILDAQPIISLGSRSSAGYPSVITGVVWYFDGIQLVFVLNGSTWVSEANGKPFQARINGSKYELKIVGNIASASVVANKQISYDMSCTCNSMDETVRGSVDVIIQCGGSDSHIMQITTNRVELDDANPSATLTAVAYYGTNPITIGQNGYTIKWYKNGSEIAGQTGSTLNVDRSMVRISDFFNAKLFLNNVAVAQDTIRIGDITDEYEIDSVPTSAGANYVALNHPASYNLSLLRNGVAYTGQVTFTWKIYNALGQETKGDGTGSTVTVQPQHCLIAQDSYADFYYEVVANF